MLSSPINCRDKAPASILTKVPPHSHSSPTPRTCTPFHTSSRLSRRSLQRSLRILNCGLGLDNLLRFRLGALLRLLDLVTEFLEVIPNPLLERWEDSLGLLDSCSLILLRR